MTVESKPTPPASFGQRLGNALIVFLRGLVRLIVVLAFVVFLGAILFYGFPWFYTHYVIPL